MINQSHSPKKTDNQTQPEAAKPKQPRQFVRFSFYKLDPRWLQQPEELRELGNRQLRELVDQYARQGLIRTHGLYGLRTDCDVMIWQATYEIEDLRDFATSIRRSAIGPYFQEVRSFLSMTKRSVYVGKNARGAHDPRLVIEPRDKKYLFVYPFVKTRAWYALPLEDRKRMMDEHIRIGVKYSDIFINTTYSFGVDDQEFVVAFESDSVADFLDLVQELRESEASSYTLRDTPMFTCVSQSMESILEALGA